MDLLSISNVDFVVFLHFQREKIQSGQINMFAYYLHLQQLYQTGQSNGFKKKKKYLK